MTKTTGRDFRAEASVLAAQDYPFEVRKTEFDTYFINVADLPGCTTEAETMAEAIEQLEDAKIAWIAAALRNNRSIPNPENDDAFSGKFVTRIGKSTHRRIAAAAQRDGISLNAWVMEAISFRLGHTDSVQAAPAQSAKLEAKMVFSPAPSGQVIEMSEWRMNPTPSKVSQC